MRFCTAMCLAALAFGADCSTMLAQTLTTLATFNGSNGDLPYSGLVADGQSNFYGTTFYGGDYGYGSVFKFDANTHSLSTVGSFNLTNGANPVNYGQLVMDGQGNLYGTTAAGGANHAGTVFEWSAATHEITAVVSFNQATTGYFPYAGLSLDPSGNFYGATQFGGPGNGGTIFEVDGATHSLTTLKTLVLQDYTNGWSPIGSPTPDGYGNLYGVTATTVFKLNIATQQIKTLISFTGQNGDEPTGISLASNGKWYGVTRDGGANNNGVIFELNPETDAVRIVATLDAMTALPHAPMIAGADGYLYGTTYYGGTSELGSVFRFDPATDEVKLLASFDGTNGASPSSVPFLDATGNIFGTATGGDFKTYGLGSIFEVSVPEPSDATVLLICFGVLGLRRRNSRFLFSSNHTFTSGRRAFLTKSRDRI